MPTNHEPRSDDASRLPDLEPAPLAQDDAVKAGSDATAFEAFFTCLRSCADSKGQVQGELARFR